MLFEGISFNINEGDKIALVAPNGTGKSTLLKILAGVESSDRGGEVKFMKDIKVAFLDQTMRFNPERTIFEEKNDVFIHCLSKIEKGHQMQFWQFFWSNIVDGKSQEKEFEVLYNINKEKYPNLMKTMSIAFEYFNNGVLFMSDFNNNNSTK